MLYPLSYEGGGWRIPGRKLRSRRAFVNDLGDGEPDSGDGARSWRRGRPFGGRARAKAEGSSRWGKLGGELVGAVSPVAVEGEPVDHERVAEQVEVLARVSDAVGPADPEAVFDIAVD